MRLRPRAEVIAFKGPRVLADLTGSWVVFPGGGVDKNEAPREAARREFREEAGRDVTTLTPALEPSVQMWPKGYARKAAWSRDFVGGYTHWFTGSTSLETDAELKKHKDHQSGFAWHHAKDVIAALKKELAGAWSADVRARIGILEAHLAGRSKIAKPITTLLR